MISQKEMLNIICTEAIEFGGLQEMPGQQHGGRTMSHAAKRAGRRTQENSIAPSRSDLPSVEYDLRLIRKTDGTLQWND